MIKNIIIPFFLSLIYSFDVTSQESLRFQKGDWTYHILFKDSSSYTLYSDGNIIETGLVELERGKVEYSLDTITLISNKQESKYALRKMILTKKDKVLANKYYFRTKENPTENWEIIRIENKSFYDRIIVEGIDNKD